MQQCHPTQTARCQSSESQDKPSDEQSIAQLSKYKNSAVQINEEHLCVCMLCALEHFSTVQLIQIALCVAQVDSVKQHAVYVSQLRRVGKGLGVYIFDQELSEGDAA
jgi:hypothetical protein